LANYYGELFWFAKRKALLKRYRLLRGSIERLIRGDDERLLLQGVIDRFDVQYTNFGSGYMSIPRSLFQKVMFKKIRSFYNVACFSIFSANFIKNNSKVFDETYTSSGETEDASMRIPQERIAFVNYKLGHYGGRTLDRNSV